MPRLSLVIPVFNRARVLAETLESCLAQTCADIEVVAVDDGSTDASADILDAFAARDARVRVWKSVNMGQCVARNIGASLAQGEWVWFLDSDDLLLPHAVERMLAVASADPSARMAMCWEEPFWDKDRDAVRDAVMAQTPGEPKTVGLWGYWPAQGFSFNTAIIRRDAFLASGGFQPALKACEEMNLTFKLLWRDPDLRVVANPQRLVLKRLDEGSLAAEARRDDTPWQLVSLLRSAEACAKAGVPGDSAIRRYLFDQLYLCCVYARRDGRIGWARLGFETWRGSGLQPPRLHPAYHDRLHRLLGFHGAESLLAGVRRLCGRSR